MKIYDISFNKTTCSNITVSQSNTCTQSSTVSTVSNEPTTLITNIGLTFPGRVVPLKPISANEDNTIYGFNTVGMSEIDPCFGWACSNTLKIRGNVEICKNLHVHGHTQLVDTSVNDLEVSGNLIVHGHSQLVDISGSNLSLSNNLYVTGATNLTGHLIFADASGSNLDISNDLGVTGHTSVTDLSATNIDISNDVSVFGNLILQSETVTAAGALSVLTPITFLGASAVGAAYTLPNGINIGQQKQIITISANDGVLTPTTRNGAWASAEFVLAGECLLLVWSASGWSIVGRSGGTAASIINVAGGPKIT